MKRSSRIPRFQNLIIMSKSSKFIMIALIVLSATACNAQTKNQKTETLKIYGNCGMCETTIEKAGNMKNQANVDWNKETKMATISYDSLKTSKEEILKRIALAGYDSDAFLAPDDTYANLPSCCQYDRAKKTSSKMDESKMVMTTEDHSMHSGKMDVMKEDHSKHSDKMDVMKDDHSMHSGNMDKMQDQNQLSKVFDNYFAVKDALVKTDGSTASTNAKNLLSAINEVKMDKLPMDVHMAWMKVLENLKEDAQHISDTKDVSNQRDHFNMLSKNMYGIIKLSKQATPTYYQFCPMANEGKGANWLSKEQEIKNPYYGSQMLSCGKTVETIDK